MPSQPGREHAAGAASPAPTGKARETTGGGSPTRAARDTSTEARGPHAGDASAEFPGGEDTPRGSGGGGATPSGDREPTRVPLHRAPPTRGFPDVADFDPAKYLQKRNPESRRPSSSKPAWAEPDRHIDTVAAIVAGTVADTMAGNLPPAPAVAVACVSAVLIAWWMMRRQKSSPRQPPGSPAAAAERAGRAAGSAAASVVTDALNAEGTGDAWDAPAAAGGSASPAPGPAPVLDDAFWARLASAVSDPLGAYGLVSEPDHFRRGFAEAAVFAAGNPDGAPPWERIVLSPGAAGRSGAAAPEPSVSGSALRGRGRGRGAAESEVTSGVSLRRAAGLDGETLQSIIAAARGAPGAMTAERLEATKLLLQLEKIQQGDLHLEAKQEGIEVLKAANAIGASTNDLRAAKMRVEDEARAKEAAVDSFWFACGVMLASGFFAACSQRFSGSAINRLKFRKSMPQGETPLRGMATLWWILGATGLATSAIARSAVVVVITWGLLRLNLPGFLHGRSPRLGAVIIGVVFWLAGQWVFLTLGGKTDKWDVLWPMFYLPHAARILFPGLTQRLGVGDKKGPFENGAGGFVLLAELIMCGLLPAAAGALPLLKWRL